MASAVPKAQSVEIAGKDFSRGAGRYNPALHRRLAGVTGVTGVVTGGVTGGVRPPSRPRLQTGRAAASAASVSMPAQSPAAISFAGATQEPPTQTTFGRPR